MPGIKSKQDEADKQLEARLSVGLSKDIGRTYEDYLKKASQNESYYKQYLKK